MHNFPVPYPNELVYSTVARAGIYHGITSPKQLLDEVFQNRKVIATLDLPCHLQAIANQLQSTMSMKEWAEELGYEGEPIEFNQAERARLQAELGKVRISHMAREHLLVTH